MRPLLAAVVFVGATLTAVAADDEKFTSKDGKFTIQFPKGAKVKSTEQDQNGSKLYAFMVEADGKSYGVMYSDLSAAVKNVPAKLILDGAEKGAANTEGCKLEGSKEVTLGKDKFPGRDMLIDKAGDKARTRFYVVDGRMYVVLLGGKKDFATSKDADAFLESFQVTK